MELLVFLNRNGLLQGVYSFRIVLVYNFLGFIEDFLMVYCNLIILLVSLINGYCMIFFYKILSCFLLVLVCDFVVFINDYLIFFCRELLFNSFKYVFQIVRFLVNMISFIQLFFGFNYFIFLEVDIFINVFFIILQVYN